MNVKSGRFDIEANDVVPVRFGGEDGQSPAKPVWSTALVRTNGRVNLEPVLVAFKDVEFVVEFVKVEGGVVGRIVEVEEEIGGGIVVVRMV